MILSISSISTEDLLLWTYWLSTDRWTHCDYHKKRTKAAFVPKGRETDCSLSPQRNSIGVWTSYFDHLFLHVFKDFIFKTTRKNFNVYSLSSSICIRCIIFSSRIWPSCIEFPQLLELLQLVFWVFFNEIVTLYLFCTTSWKNFIQLHYICAQCQDLDRWWRYLRIRAVHHPGQDPGSKII